MAAIRRRNFRAIAWNTGLQAAVFVLAQLAGGLIAPSILILVAADAISRFGSAWHFRRYVSHSERFADRWAEIRMTAIRYRRFAILTTPATILNGLSLQVPIVVLTSRYGAAVGGYFGLVQRIAGAPTAVLGRALSQAFYGRAAEVRRTGSARLRALFRRTVGASAAVAILLVAPVLFVVSLVTGVVFGREWDDAGLYLRILLPMFVMQVVNLGVEPTLSVMERQDLHLIREVWRAILTLMPLGAAITLNKSPTSAVGALAIGGTIAYAGYIATAWQAVRRPYDT